MPDCLSGDSAPDENEPGIEVVNMAMFVAMHLTQTGQCTCICPLDVGLGVVNLMRAHLTDLEFKATMEDGECGAKHFTFIKKPNDTTLPPVS